MKEGVRSQTLKLEKLTNKLICSDLTSALARSLQLINTAATKGGSNLVQDTVYDAEGKLFSRMVDVSMSVELEETLEGYVRSLRTSRDQVERSRLKASEVVTSLVPLACKSDRIRALLGQEITNALEDERSVGVQLSLKRAQKSLYE